MLCMRFKDFVWPNNPYSCSLTTRRETAYHKFPGGGYSLEDLGMGLRKLSGTGEFYGPGAYESMKKMLKVFYEGGTGRLIHPVIQFQQAVFAELELLQEPREDYVLYRFTFWEESGQQPLTDAVGSVGNHQVQEGESLWEIAAMYGTTASALMAYNPWIQNPNVLTAGKTVVIQ